MNEVTVPLSDQVLRRLDEEAQRLDLSLEAVINTVILYFSDEGVPDEQAILLSLHARMGRALASNYRPAHEVLDEIERETTADPDAG